MGAVIPSRRIAMWSFDTLGKHREHGLWFGGGLVAGLVLFLLWLSLQPSRKVEAPSEAASTAAAHANGPARQPDGVLGDIAGEFQPGARTVIDAPTDEPEPEPPLAGEPGEGPDAVDGPPTDEEAIAGALLSPEGGEGTPTLQTWYVEVARGPDVSEILEIAAPSADQALVVLRDFRGNPRVLRGPSPQPFP